MKTQINFLGIGVPVRYFTFLIIGILCGIYFLVSSNFDFFPKFDFWFRISSIIFIFIYPLFTSIIAWIFPAYKWYLATVDVLFYSIGGIIGAIFYLLIAFIILISWGLSELIYFLIGI